MKWLFRIFGLVIIVVCVAIGSVLLLPGDRLAKIASDQISAQLGRNVEIGGDVSFSFYPVLGVKTGPITIANADWAGETPMFQAQSAHIGLEAAPLIRREIRVKALHADAPQILLQTQGDGTANWEFFPESASTSDSTSTTSAASDFSIADLSITNGSIRYEENGTPTVAYDGVNLSIQWPDQAQPADVTLVLRPANDDVTIQANISSPTELFAGGTQPINATVSTNGGKLTFTGVAGIAPEAKGKLSANLSSTAGFLQALGLGNIDLPDGAGKKIQLSSSLLFGANQTLSLNGLDATLDQNRFSGDISVTLADKPVIDARLNAGALDFSTLAGGSSSSSSDTAWSKAPIDASALGSIDGKVSLDAASLDLGTLKLGKTRAVLTIDRSRAVVTLQEAAAYQGNITGEFVMNNRNGLSVGGKLNSANVEAQDMLSALAGIDRLSGKANSEIQFLGVGQSVAQIMNSLKGSGNFSFGRGVISGIDLDKLMRSGDATGGTTIFDSLAASYRMENGVLKNDDLLMKLPLIQATGDGRVNLGKQTIDYTFTPKLLETDDRRGLAIPVQIKGAWSGPRISADLEKAIDLNFAEEKKKVEEEVVKKVGEELGVEVEEGDTIEDAVKKKVEDEILKGIGGLLGGN